MAVIGAKGNFGGPGASSAEDDDSKQEIVCTQVSNGTKKLNKGLSALALIIFMIVCNKWVKYLQ